jgi:hypothetical protein
MAKCELCKKGKAVVSIAFTSLGGGTIPFRGVSRPGCCKQCLRAIRNKLRELAGMCPIEEI